MIANRSFEGGSPLTWIGSFPVYLATAIAGVHVVTMALTAIAMGVAAAGPAANPWLAPLLFSWESGALQGHLWQFVTYVFVNPPSIWVLIQIVLLAVFGSEVEKFLGRTGFAWFYVALVLAGPLLLCVLGLFGVDWVLAGGAYAGFGVFLAFVFLYPRAQIFFGIEARWIAAVLVGLYTLQGFAARDPLSVGMLLWTGMVALVYLRWEGAAEFAAAALPKAEPSAKRSKRTKPARSPKAPKAPKGPDLHDSIDPILDKISKSGIGSLTKDERERLERARSALLQRENKS
jgi:membrane associated rhomboid family serine protease